MLTTTNESLIPDGCFVFDKKLSSYHPLWLTGISGTFFKVKKHQNTKDGMDVYYLHVYTPGELQELIEEKQEHLNKLQEELEKQKRLVYLVIRFIEFLKNLKEYETIELAKTVLIGE